MFARTLSTMTTRLFGAADDVDDPSDLDRVAVERRLREVERKRREIRAEVESLRRRYRGAVARADRVDESGLDGVRGELSRLVEAAAVGRATYRRAVLKHRALQLLSAPAHSPQSLADLDLDGEQKSVGVRAPLWVAPGHLDPPPDGFVESQDREGPVARVRDEVGDVDATVQDVVTAARSDAPVPTLRSLLESDAGDGYDAFLRDSVEGGGDEHWRDDGAFGRASG